MVAPAHPQRTAALALVILLLCCRQSLALDPSFDANQYAHSAWKTRNGFVGWIHSIAQTPDGFLWLGTEHGLFRYDGVRTVPALPPAQKLPSDVIFTTIVGRDGTVWIGTYAGLRSWKNGLLTQYPQLGEERIFGLFEDREGTIWAGGFTTTPPGKLCAIRGTSIRCYGGTASLAPASSECTRIGYSDCG